MYGNLALHIPNNADYTVTPDNGKMITAQGCTAISSADPQIAQYHKVATAAGVDYAPIGESRVRNQRPGVKVSRRVLAGALFPSWQDFQPFLITGLALGGVYALSGVGMVVLYRATGVLYLAFGAVGAFGALVAWQLTSRAGTSGSPTLVCVAVSRLITLAYGMVFGSALAGREPLVKATATLGLTLILLGVMDLLWTSSGGESRSISLPTDNHGFMVGQINVTTTQVIALAAGS